MGSFSKLSFMPLPFSASRVNIAMLFAPDALASGSLSSSVQLKVLASLTLFSPSSTNSSSIMGSFSRKYAALSGMKLEELQKLFKFRPVTIGADLEINGGKFKFFYCS